MPTHTASRARRGTAQEIATIALVGNPNTGKTTLFNAFTGLSQRVGNYPGVTVERKFGRVRSGEEGHFHLLDLPGTYSLSAYSPDEMIVVDVLLGQQEDEVPVDAVVAIVDACNLRRNLYLVSQLLDLGQPLVVALNMTDVAEARGIEIDVATLSGRIGVPVVPICATQHLGLDKLRETIAKVLNGDGGLEQGCPFRLPETLAVEAKALAEELNGEENGEARVVSDVEALRTLVDEGGYAEHRLTREQGARFGERLAEIRSGAWPGSSATTLEADARLAWIREVARGCITRPNVLQSTRSDRIDRVMTHRIHGSLVFVVIMGLVFQAIYSWAGPLMDQMNWLWGVLGAWVGTALPPGALNSLLVDAVIGGVGAVLIFLPQIAILFFFLAILEDCGYMARAAFLMDRLLRRCGLSGRSFIPMLSCFACAVPGIMATRTIEDRRDRFTTILVAPLMSCSARLPVYTILIAAFIPDRSLLGGWVGLQGLTLFGTYALGIAVAVPVAWLLKGTLMRGEAAPFILEFPSYRVPNARTVGLRVYQSCSEFIRRAGTIILVSTVVMWALAYFPRPPEIAERYEARRREVLEDVPSQDRADATARLEAELSSTRLRQSYLGRAGQLVEPIVRPLGWDWKIGMATIASFPAREVIVSTLGTIYSLGQTSGETREQLGGAMRRQLWADGSPVFTIPVALSIMVFFALCAQCVSTLAMIKQETRGWRWALFAFSYMTLLAYVCAFAVYRVTVGLGWGG